MSKQKYNVGLSKFIQNIIAGSCVCLCVFMPAGGSIFQTDITRWEFVIQISISASGSCAKVAAYVSEPVRVSAPCFNNSISLSLIEQWNMP